MAFSDFLNKNEVQCLQIIAAQLSGVLPGAQQVSATTVATTNGSTAAGLTSVTFVVGAGATVTIEGATYAAGASLTKTAALGRTLPSIPYTVSGGNLTISTLA